MTEGNFLYVKPLEFLRMLWRQFKRGMVWCKDKIVSLVKPLFKAGKGLAHYIQLIGSKVVGFFRAIGKVISGTLNQIGGAIYRVVKSVA